MADQGRSDFRVVFTMSLCLLELKRLLISLLFQIIRLWYYVCMLSPRGHFHSLTSEGSPKFCLHNFCQSPKFPSWNMGDNYPKICPMYPKILPLNSKLFLLFGRIAPNIGHQYPKFCLWISNFSILFGFIAPNFAWQGPSPPPPPPDLKKWKCSPWVLSEAIWSWFVNISFIAYKIKKLVRKRSW